MKITIREGIKEDLPTVLKLIKELADYENAIDQVSITIEELEKDGFEGSPWYWFLVAHDDLFHRVATIVAHKFLLMKEKTNFFDDKIRILYQKDFEHFLIQ